jgi:uncharacterized membrane protein YfcA
MIYDIAASFLISILTGMGMGSAGLMVMYLTTVRGVPQLSAQGANLFLFVASSAFSLILQFSRNIIKWGTVILLTAAGCAGTYLGYRVASRIDPGTVRVCFAALLILTGCISIVKIAKEYRQK